MHTHQPGQPRPVQEELPQNMPPMRAQVVQRLQRFATHGQLRQVVLRAIAGSVVPEHAAELHPGAREWLESARALFQEFDVDASGSVSMEELADGLARLGFQLSQGELDTLMSRLYASREGALQMNEFLACLVDWGILQRSSHWRTWVRAVFDRLDKDGNGYIDLQELATELGDHGAPAPDDEGASRGLLVLVVPRGVGNKPKGRGAARACAGRGFLPAWDGARARLLTLHLPIPRQTR